MGSAGFGLVDATVEVSPGIVARAFLPERDEVLVDAGEEDFLPGSKNMSTGRAGLALDGGGVVSGDVVSRETSVFSSGAVAAGELEISAPSPLPKPRFFSAI